MASHFRSDDVSIPLFNGSDYEKWKFRLLLFLELKKCRTVAERSKTATDRAEDWDPMEVKAKNYVVSAITNEQLELVYSETTAFGMLTKFDNLYLKTSTALQIISRRKLESIRLEENSDSSKFFNDFEKAVNELRAAGAVVTEDEKANYLIRAIPESLAYLGDLVDVIDKTKENVFEYLKYKIIVKARSTGSGGNSASIENGVNSQVFAAKSGNRSSNSGSTFTCYRCGKEGHRHFECPDSNNTESNGQGFSSGRGRRADFHGRGYGRQGRSSFTRRAGSNNVRNSYTQQHGNGRGNCFYTEVNISSIVENGHVSTLHTQNIRWLLDSGCSQHIINNDLLFEMHTILDKPIDVKLGDRRVLAGTKVGNVRVLFRTGNRDVHVNIKNVLYVKGMGANLLSSSKVAKINTIVESGNSARIFNRQRELIAVARLKNNLYWLDSTKVEQPSSNVITMPEPQVNVTISSEMSLKEKWHRILGHINFAKLKILCEDGLLDGAPKRLESEKFKCAICLENKLSNVPFNNDREKAKQILQIVHTDVNGPHSTGYGGEQYFLTFIDDYSKLVKVYCLKSKSEVYNYLVEYVNLVENLTEKRIKEIRCDNGTEYINKRVDEFVKNRGIYLRPCIPYVHELNGTAECYNRILMDKARCLLAEARVDRKFWPECIQAAAYLTNRSLASTVEHKTPFEIFFGKKPDVRNLKLYGSRVYARIPDVKRGSKWDRKADYGILLGYTDLGYRILVKNRVIVTRHVNFVDKTIKCITLRDDGDDESSESREPQALSEQVVENSEEALNRENVVEAGHKDQEPSPSPPSIAQHSQDSRKSPRRSSRERKVPTKLNDCIVYVNYCSADTPDTYQDAMSRPDANLWQKAIDREIYSLESNETWKEVPLPQGKRALDVKWVFKVKSDGTYRARLVVRGFQQEDELDDIYSPVARMCTLKLLLSFCCQQGLTIHQMDVETAFLNGRIVSEVYIKPPLGCSNVIDVNNVLHLRKSLYGLKESPRNWYECFNDFVSKLGFERNKFDYCLYINKTNVNYTFIILFVDDLLICSKCLDNIREVKRKLSEHFKMKDMGKVSSYLGIEIDYSAKDKVMTLCQKNYIETLATKYNVINSILYNTPMEAHLKLEKAEVTDFNVKYRNLIGALLYISAGTRPDITFSVNYLSRFQSAYNNTHFSYALRVLKYLYKTRDLKLTYQFNRNYEGLDAYVDSDWAGDIVDRRSTSGFVIRMHGNPILWKSLKQGNVTKSSTHAEYVALSEAVTEVMYLLGVCGQFVHSKTILPVKIFEDNLGAVCIANLGNFTRKSKHIEVHFHFVNEAILAGQIEVVKVDSSENLADIFTKSLSKPIFVKLRDSLCII